MFIKINHFTGIKRGFGRNFSFVLATAAALYGFASAPAEATMAREVPRLHAPAIHHAPRNPAIQRTVISNTLRTVRAAAGRAKTDGPDESPSFDINDEDQDAGAKPKAALEKKKKELEKREKELKDKLAKIKDDFLKSKKGKATKKKLDKEDAKRKKKYKKIVDERNKKIDACCVSSSIWKAEEWFRKAWKKLRDETEKAKKKIFEDDLKKQDPKKFKDYKTAEGELNKTKGEIKQAEQKLDRLNKPTNKARVQP